MTELNDSERNFLERVKPLVNSYLEMSREVGSYVLSENDSIHHGVPFDTGIREVHGEENAVGTMLTEEGKNTRFRIILIVGSPSDIVMPCGICREVIRRYGAENATVLCSNQSFTKIERFTIPELYPHPYIE